MRLDPKGIHSSDVLHMGNLPFIYTEAANASTRGLIIPSKAKGKAVPGWFPLCQLHDWNDKIAVKITTVLGD